MLHAGAGEKLADVLALQSRGVVEEVGGVASLLERLGQAAQAQVGIAQRIGLCRLGSTEHSEAANPRVVWIELA